MKLTALERETLPRDLVVAADMFEAQDRGDDAEYYRLLRELNIPAETLMALKRGGRSSLIRELGLKTDLADAKYGPGWLDEPG